MIENLTEDQRSEVCKLFRLACLRRAQQWDAESAIERILGHEIDVDIADWAVNVSTSEELAGTMVFSDQEILEELGRHLREISVD